MAVFKVLKGIEDVQEILDRLDKVRAVAGKQEWSARCPNHDDRKNSLSVGVSGDRILVFCHAGCRTEEVVQAIGFRMCDLFLEVPEAPLPPSGPKHIVATYPYYDADGVLLFEKVRYEPKWFEIRRIDNQGHYVLNADGIPRPFPLYRLPQLIASNGSSPVYLCEGEKDAERLADLGLTSTTLPGGSGTRWHPNYSEVLKGKDVVLIPDNDSAGEIYADACVKGLYGIARTLRIIRLPGLPMKGDVSDWLEQHTKDELLALVAQEQEYGASSRFQLLRADEVTEEDDEPMEFVVAGLLTRGSLSALIGAPEAMKTWSCLDMAACIATGRPWIGKDTIKGGVLLIDEESGRRRLKKRLRMVKRGHALMAGSVPITCTVLGAFNPRDKQDIACIEELIRKERAITVFIDAFADILSGGDENLVKDVEPIMQALRGIAERTQTAIVMIHHTNRQGAERGSSAIKGAVDLMVLADRRENSNTIDWKSIKARDVEPFKLSMVGKFDDEAQSFRLALTMPKPEAPQYSASEAMILEYIQQNGPSTITEIHGTGKFSESTIKHSIYALVHQDILERADIGGTGQKALYQCKCTGVVQPVQTL